MDERDETSEATEPIDVVASARDRGDEPREQTAEPAAHDDVAAAWAAGLESGASVPVAPVRSDEPPTTVVPAVVGLGPTAPPPYREGGVFEAPQLDEASEVAQPAAVFGAPAPYDAGNGAPPPPWYSAPAGYGAFPPPPPPSAPRGSGRRVVAVAAVAALVAGGLGAGLGVAFGSSSPTTTLPATGKVPVIPAPSKSTQVGTGKSESVAAIAKNAIPAIVDINTVVASETTQGQEDAAGTGMILTSTGEVLTNNHVVKDATKITVSVQGHQGSYAATVIGVNPTKDVALIQIDGFSGTLPTVALGNSASSAVGQPVVAIGNAQGLDQTPTTVTGSISALDQSITAADDGEIGGSESLHGLIETDAPIEPGDSGGPLLNSRGQVIGMDTAAESASDSGATLGFSIPINEARTLVQAMEKGKTTGGNILGLTPFLGIFETPGGASSLGGFGLGGTSGSAVSGVAVSDVAIGGPAQNAGIIGGDTITSINGTATPTIAILAKVVGAEKPGDTVQVAYVDAGGASHTASVTLAGIPK